MKTVMLVDDERPARELLKMTINWEEAGFEILWEARNGKQALELYEIQCPDLIITDIQMPVMDGLEFLERINSICPSQKVVILSCHEDFSYAKRALKLGVMDYLIKDALTEEVLYNLLKNLNASDSTNDEPLPSHSTQPKILSSILSEKNDLSEEALHILTDRTLTNEEFFCCTCCLEGFTGQSSELAILSSEIQNCLDESDGGSLCLQKSLSPYIVLYEAPKQ